MSTPIAHKMILRNTSGQRLYFGYIGRLGADLAPGQDVAVNGNLWDANRRDERAIAAMSADLAAGRLTIMKSADTYVYDDTLDQPRVLGSAAGTPTSVVPESGTYSGPIPTHS